MGQKVNPHGMRVGVIDGWNSNWYADKKSFSENLKEDNTMTVSRFPFIRLSRES